METRFECLKSKDTWTWTLPRSSCVQVRVPPQKQLKILAIHVPLLTPFYRGPGAQHLSAGKDSMPSSMCPGVKSNLW